MNFIVSYADRCQAAQQASFRAGEGRTRPHRWLVETVDRGRLTGKVVYRLRVTAVKDSKKCSVCPSPEVLVHDSAARKPSRPPTPPHISDTICTSRRSLAYSLLHLPTYVALQSSRSRRSTACPSMLTVRPTPLPPIHCTSWIMRTPLVLQWGFTVGSCCRDLGPLPCGQTILELGDVISCAPPRPRRCDLVCSTATSEMGSRVLLRGTRPASCGRCLPPGDLCPAPPETCPPEACPPETCAQHGHDGTEISIEISIRLQMHSRE